ncbi:enoyl-CoA hydratase [Balneatrix alpica]|uniref:Enoyl-CoA hydratase n=1 Tax=Balneatrix alpica TaxID=75684 RepID=A0ABV5ZCX9_9GAMM|nr:enoyl-CoA hydratase [Balneatrix alpica]
MAIAIEVENGLLSLRIERPAKKNALTQEMYIEMTEALQEAEDNQLIRVVLITGCGDSFTSGNDLGDFIAAASSQGGEVRAPLDFLQTLAAFPKPIVVAVNGLAIGIGTSMLLHCDYVLASGAATFQMPFVKLGLVPEGATSLLIPQLMGQRLAFELLVLGESISAERAQQLGLVNQVVEPELLDMVTMELVERLLSLPPEAVQISKQMLKVSQQQAISAVIEAEGVAFKERLFSTEANEALTAFMEKRPPVFR